MTGLVGILLAVTLGTEPDSIRGTITVRPTGPDAAALPTSGVPVSVEVPAGRPGMRRALVLTRELADSASVEWQIEPASFRTGANGTFDPASASDRLHWITHSADERLQVRPGPLDRGLGAQTWIRADGSAAVVEGSARTAGAIEKSGVMITPIPGGLEVKVGGRLVTRYRTDSGPKPILWPLMAPGERPVTRDYPMTSATPGEEKDHPHHRSFWFTHGKVGPRGADGKPVFHDFWSELPRAGRQKHRSFERIVSGPVFGEFVARVDWFSVSGVKVAEDTRRLRFWNLGDKAVLIDAELALQGPDGAELIIGDDKEGTFGVRVAGTMSVKQPKGKAGGRLINAEGKVDDAAWGRKSPWVDYHGPVAGPNGTEVAGITIFDAPGNLRHPTTWHVRTYGLFCANPFGLSFFPDGNKASGEHVIAKGSEWRQRYRILLHAGDERTGESARHWVGFASPPKATLSK